MSHCQSGKDGTGACLIAESVSTELLPLQKVYETAKTLKKLQPIETKTITCPRMATRNNQIKLNWWHSSAPVPKEVASPSSSPVIDNNNKTITPPINFNAPTKSKPKLKVLTSASSPIASPTYSNTHRPLSIKDKDFAISSFDNLATNADDDDHQNSQLLQKDVKQCIGVLNQDQSDQMKICGYRRSKLRTILCWVCICLSGGLLRLVLHWWRHWYLFATCKPCPLQEAQQVLIEEDYQGKHKLYHVKPVRLLSVEQLKKLLEQQLPDEHFDDSKLNLSFHFNSANFKSCHTLRIFRCKQLVYAWDNACNMFSKINGLDTNVPCLYFHHQRGLTLQEQISRRIVFGENEITIPLRNVKTLLFLENQDVLKQTVQNTGNAWVVSANGVSHEIPTKDLVPGDIIEIPSTGCTMQCDAVLLSGNCILDESMLTGESVPVTKTPLPMKRDIIFDKKEHARHTLFCGTKVIQTRYIGSKKVLAFVINTGNITAKGGLIRSILYPPPVDYKFEQDSYKFIQCLAAIACLGFVYTLVTKILRGTDPIKIVVESLDLITIVVPPALPAAMTVGRFYAQKRLKNNEIYCISPRSINVAGSIDCCCFDKTGTLTEDGLDMWGVVPKSSTNQFQIPLKDVKRLPNEPFLFSMVTCHSITIMNGKMMGDPLDLKMFDSTGWKLEDSNNIPENEKYSLIYPTILRQPKPVNIANQKPSFSVPAAEWNVQRQSSVDDLLANVGLSQTELNFDHGIVREFPFTSSLQRMSVITRCLSAQGFSVYCKGSPEMLQQLCKPNSMPDNYTHQLSMYAKKGFRIIAVAHKTISSKLNYTKVQRLSREDVEHNLEFLGFVILENRLKPDTTTVINSLNIANVRPIMVTGDNILTALSVARDCGIVHSNQAVVTVHAVPIEMLGKLDADPHIQYELQYTLELGTTAISSTDHANKSGNGNVQARGEPDAFAVNVDLTQSTYSLVQSTSYATSMLPESNSLTSVKTLDTWTHNDGDDMELGVDPSSTTATANAKNGHVAANGNWRRQYVFAMDGKTWQVIRDQFPHQLQIILTRGAIYARMSPDQKQALVVELQNLDYYVAMCGDGANDCGALKVAHTGISLSESESSIASPFTSRNPTIAAVPRVIKEGRAALVTSFGIFKYMAAYSLVQFISVMILYSIESNLTDKQYLYIDLGLISIFAFFFGKTEAYAGQLVKQVPLSSLISPTPLASLLLHLAVVIAFQVAGWFQLHQQNWFTPFQPSNNEDHLGCYENYTMFAISSFQYIILAFVFSKGAPYRKPIWSNWPLCLTLLLNVCIVVYLVVYPSEWVSSFFQLIVPPEMKFRYIMLVYGALAFIIHTLLESLVVEFLVFKKWQVKRELNHKTSNRKYMQLEYSINTFDNWPPITDIYEPHVLTGLDQQQPTYINLSAEQNLDPQHNEFPSFFETADIAPKIT
ncbi:probable cation-transporting ATPase 13A3 isoform X2 [Drosophila busckii]|uniref:probable cation-transporting ATPase 13A3 isoform X2 n=1 Tax=Drosophila busckii TaxID=30019 RepID=UPI00083EEA95|nr:probable cation-transporting ATPase 13A3 isoform X2 [Drosophila busckii]